jgi:hypothetical protein
MLHIYYKTWMYIHFEYKNLHQDLVSQCESHKILLSVGQQTLDIF